jgi:hypothetical protein
MNKEERERASQTLFVGNKLADGQVGCFDGKHSVDLRNIRAPIMVSASRGDNITPPLDSRPDMPGQANVDGRHMVQFVPRTLDDILALDDDRKDELAFAVPAARNQIGAHGALDVLRCQPGEGVGDVMAEQVRNQGKPVSRDNPLLQVDRDMPARIEQSLDQYRDARDRMSERLFKRICESPWLAAAVGIDERGASCLGPRAAGWEHEGPKRLKRNVAEANFEQCTVLDAWARLLLYLGREEKVADERRFNLMQRPVKEMKPADAPTPAALNAAVKRQAFVLAMDEERAITAPPKLAPDVDERRRGFAAARSILGAHGEPTPYQEERSRRVAALLGLHAPASVRKAA